MKRVALFCTASIEVITLFCHGFQIDATYSSLGGQMWCRPIYLERGCLQVVSCSKVKIQKSLGGQTPRLGTCYPSAVCRDAWEICSLACGTWWDIYGRSVVGSVVESCNFAQCKLLLFCISLHCELHALLDGLSSLTLSFTVISDLAVKLLLLKRKVVLFVDKQKYLCERSWDMSVGHITLF